MIAALIIAYILYILLNTSTYIYVINTSNIHFNMYNQFPISIYAHPT